MKLSIINKISAILVMLINLLFVPLTVKILYTDGGAMGIGWMIFPFSLAFNLLLIPAILVFKKKFEDNITCFTFNLLGAIATITALVLISPLHII